MWFVALLILAVIASPAWAQPTTSTVFATNVADCTGAASQSNAASFANPTPPPDFCQSYDVDTGADPEDDLYESLNPDGGGFTTSDIQACRARVDVGQANGPFLVFEWDTVADWDETTGTGHSYYIEFDADPSTETPLQSDFFFTYKALASHVGTAWVATGASQAKIFEDTDDDYGEPNQGESDQGSTSSDGYDTEASAASTDMWVRIVDGDPQLGVRVAYLNTLVPGDVTEGVFRCWVFQSSSESKFPWHDFFTLSDLGTVGDNSSGSKFDNTSGQPFDDPVPVTLSFFQAVPKGQQVRIEWSTATELGNVGFDIYAEGVKGMRRLNKQLIRSQAVDSDEPRNYSFEAAGVEGEEFHIVAVDTQGSERSYGPYGLAEVYGARATPELVNWTLVRAETEGLRAARAGNPSRLMNGDFGATKAAADSKAAPARSRTGSTARFFEPFEFRVTSDGLYRVTYEQLLAAGVDMAEVPLGALALTNRGVPIPIQVAGDGRLFGPGSYIEFVGRANDSLYTRTNVYILSSDRALARRVEVEQAANASGASPDPFYLETATVDKNLVYGPGSPTGDPWYEASLRADSTPVEHDFVLNVENLVDAGAAASLTVGLWGVTDWPETPDHHVIVEVNDVPVAEEFFDGFAAMPIVATLPPGTLREGANKLTLIMPGDRGVRYDIVNLDSHSVRYPRAFASRGGQLVFDAEGGGVYRIEGLSADVVIYRIEGEKVTLVEGARVEPSNGSFAAVLRGAAGPATYLVYSQGSIGSPALEPARPFENITSGSAEFLIISHPNFLEGIERLAAARRAQGLQVRVVDVEDIYAQFSHGIVDPQAIRSFIAHAAANMGTESVLLTGGDTYDYFDYLGLGSVSFIPSIYVPTGMGVQFAPADPLYADVDGDNIPDLAIGRFPVRTTAELDSIVDKTLAYASSPSWRKALFAADKSDGLLKFGDQSESFIEQLPPGWTVQRTYLSQLGKEEARRLFLETFDGGVALASFFGHSGPSVWTFDQFFSADDAANLGNAGKPAVVTQWGCWNTYFVTPKYNTLGHKLLLSGDRGAAAVLGATTLTSGTSELALGRILMGKLFDSDQTLGGAVQAAKAQLAQTSPSMVDVILGWSLLGDPTLQIKR